MFAATVTGAPVENACRLIADYEHEGRGLRRGAGSLRSSARRVADDGQPDPHPHRRRLAERRAQGTAGATLVRDSDAASEVAETRAKAGGILSAFGLAAAAGSDGTDIADLARDEDVLLSLGSRNGRLSRFWLTDQAGEPADPGLADRSVVILHGEDDFVNMLVHVLGVFGMTSRVVRHEDYETGAFDGADLVIVGPGPGDPREGDHPKIASFRRAVDDLLASGQPFLAVCLGHQTLCQRLGLDLAYKDVVFQGTQSPVRLDGRTERVGFYNTFVGRVPDGAALPDGVRRSRRGHRRHPRGHRSALPRHPVPRRVDPHRERLRPAPRRGARPADLRRGGSRPSPAGWSVAACRAS